MKSLTFITGNASKAEQLKRHLPAGIQVDHQAVELTEIQSLDPIEVVTHKVKEAYQLLKKPVLVEDTSLVFSCLGKLPGPFIKWFLHELGNEGICQMLDNFADRSAICTVNFAFFDGKNLKIFSATMRGSIAKQPRKGAGFGWDPIFINEGFTKTRGEMSLEEYHSTSPRKIAVAKLHDYLKQL